MADHLILLATSANRVYASEADRLVAAELKIMLGGGDHPRIEPIRLAGVGYIALGTETLEERVCQALGRLSACYAAFRREHDRLQPIEISTRSLFDDDLVTIPKYPGKTNEQFTRLLINVTLTSMQRSPGGPIAILDPMCGRGTTLSTAMMLGCNAAGVEVDPKAVEAYAAYLRTLRRFDAVVADAPYGVVHGSHTGVCGAGGGRDRSAAGLISEALPVCAGQLKAAAHSACRGTRLA
jgi:hypothetical protein